MGPDQVRAVGKSTAVLPDRSAPMSWVVDAVGDCWLRASRCIDTARDCITVAELVGKARGRANVQVFAGHPSTARVIRQDVVARDWDILGLAGATSEDVDGYVGAADLHSVVERYALIASASGNITLRGTDFDLSIVRSLSKASDVLVALNAASSIDPRTRGAGERVLERALARLSDQRGWSR